MTKHKIMLWNKAYFKERVLLSTLASVHAQRLGLSGKAAGTEVEKEGKVRVREEHRWPGACTSALRVGGRAWEPGGVPSNCLESHHSLSHLPPSPLPPPCQGAHLPMPLCPHPLGSLLPFTPSAIPG